MPFEMVSEERVTNGDGTASTRDGLGAKNGSTNGFLDCSTSVAGNGNSTAVSNKALRTYKRRKHRVCYSEFKLSQNKEHSSDAALAIAQSQDKVSRTFTEISCGHDILKSLKDEALAIAQSQDKMVKLVELGSDNCPYHQPWRSVVEHMCRALNMTKDGAGGYLVPQATSGGHEGQGHTLRASTRDGSSNSVERAAVINSNGTSMDLSKLTVTKQGGIAFLKLIMSEKFASLRMLFHNNFHGLEVDKFFNFNLISSRMMEGTYEQKPDLLFSDVQQFWRKLHIVGAEMVSLSMSLSELSTFFFREPVSGLGDSLSDDGKHKFMSGKQFPARCSEWHSKLEQPSSSFRPCTCRCCGEESDGRDCLVCDSCEDIFHVTCIKPTVKEIPHKNWYCANCIAVGAEALHENCAVCGRLDSFARIKGDGGNSVPTDEETVDGLEENSNFVKENRFQMFKGGKKEYCLVCKSVLEPGEIFRLCEHRYCCRHYHLRCLTKKQLKSYGPRWYCPCCLCRVCLTDKDDHKIILCDACDHGYHIYCISPPLDSIPQGQWFCRKCHAGIQAINKVKRSYASAEEQRTQGGRRKRVNVGPRGKQNQDRKKEANRSGGMDMLLNAADTLNLQEELDLLGAKS